LKKTIGASLALALAATSVTALGVASASASPRSTSVVREQPQEPKYSTEDVLSFFVLGTGPLFESHADLAGRLGLTYQKVPANLVTDVVDRFQAADPQLLERVIEPVQSGDPLRAQQGMEALSEDSQIVNRALLAEQGKKVANKNRASARGWLYTTSYVATIQIGAAAAYVAALGAAVVAGVFVVLYEPSGEVTDYDRQLAARAISGDLRN